MTLGQRIGPFRLVEQIGEGSMGEVFVAEHAVLEHRVAVKILHPHHVGNPHVEQRFMNEAQAIASIRHSGVVDLFDIGRTDDGRAYIVMELLEGETLAELLEVAPLAERNAIALARQMASALAATHAHGVVHRDLKPGNVLVVPDDAVATGARAVILDFGIAKVQRASTAAPITASGVLIGTPRYMAPEQCNGAAVDQRTDVYALGLVLFEMVTGQAPFTGERTAEMLADQMYVPAPRADGTGAPVSTALADVIGRCLAKDPDERYATMAEVEEALEGIATAAAAAPERGEPTLPEPSWIDATTAVHVLAASPPRRALRRFGVPAVMLAAALVGTALGTHSARQSHADVAPVPAIRATAPVGETSAPDEEPPADEAARADEKAHADEAAPARNAAANPEASPANEAKSSRDRAPVAKKASSPPRRRKAKRTPRRLQRRAEREAARTRAANARKARAPAPALTPDPDQAATPTPDPRDDESFRDVDVPSVF